MGVIMQYIDYDVTLLHRAFWHANKIVDFNSKAKVCWLTQGLIYIQGDRISGIIKAPAPNADFMLDEYQRPLFHQFSLHSKIIHLNDDSITFDAGYSTILQTGIEVPPTVPEKFLIMYTHTIRSQIMAAYEYLKAAAKGSPRFTFKTIREPEHLEIATSHKNHRFEFIVPVIFCGSHELSCKLMPNITNFLISNILCPVDLSWTPENVFWSIVSDDVEITYFHQHTEFVE
jgi:hypothetical protein